MPLTSYKTTVLSISRTALLTAGASRPDTNFAGIEIVRKYQLFTATRLAKRELRNVRVACGDAKLLLRDRIPAGSLHAVWSGGFSGDSYRLGSRWWLWL